MNWSNKIITRTEYSQSRRLPLRLRLCKKTSISVCQCDGRHSQPFPNQQIFHVKAGLRNLQGSAPMRPLRRVMAYLTFFILLLAATSMSTARVLDATVAGDDLLRDITEFLDRNGIDVRN